ncbi:MAG: hypothetical protein GF388_11435 [Candidatus Aegiribacteria sp.]|nr:hypothetical protein [Candidatus Aegiribacteria sp.]
MRFYTSTHQYYCGIDLHTRVMYLCIIRDDGEIVLHRNMKADPESLLKAVEPYRPDLVTEWHEGTHVFPAFAGKHGIIR